MSPLFFSFIRSFQYYSQSFRKKSHFVNFCFPFPHISLETVHTIVVVTPKQTHTKIVASSRVTHRAITSVRFWPFPDMCKAVRAEPEFYCCLKIFLKENFN
uniref:(northern house mosquito) hypothetical protein n=1 Tax=Culex pipiens TaxID=7175 RepID=A0A8D8AGY2_CULPI